MHLRLFLPIPSLSAPVLQGTKTEAQLGQLQKSACPPLLKIFSQLRCFVIAAALGDFTLCPCDNVNDQLSLVAFSERSRLQRTFSKGTSLINKEMAIHDQIFVCLDWPTPPPTLCKCLLLPLYPSKMQIWIIWTFKFWSTKFARQVTVTFVETFTSTQSDKSLVNLVPGIIWYMFVSTRILALRGVPACGMQAKPCWVLTPVCEHN